MKKLTDKQLEILSAADATARFLVVVACGLKAVTPRGCYWDDLDQVIAQNINDDTEAKRVVNALMELGGDVHVREGFNSWDAAEEVAIRIIGNRDLRFEVRP